MRKKYNVTMKENVVKKIIHSIDNNLDYRPMSAISRPLFEKSNFSNSFTSYNGEDYVFGKYENMPIEFSQLIVRQQSNNSNITLFDGTFIVSEYKQSFTGRCAVVPNTIEKNTGKINRFLQSLNIVRDALIKIDNQEFENHFAAYSNNVDEAKKILNGNFLNYLIELKLKYSFGVFFSYNENKFFVGLINQKDILQLNIKTELNETNLKKFYDEVLEIINIALKINSFIDENLNKN